MLLLLDKVKKQAEKRINAFDVHPSFLNSERSQNSAGAPL